MWKTVSDIIETTKSNNLESFLFVIDVEKSLDSWDHIYFCSEKKKKKKRFGQNFIFWIKPLLKNQKSCVITGGKPLNIFN